MKRFLSTETGSIGSLEGLLLAAFAVLLIVGIRNAVFSAKPEPPKHVDSVARPNDWPELPEYRPQQTISPLRD